MITSRAVSTFLAQALVFPTLVWTVLGGVAVLYWALVALGGADVDALGGAEGGADAGAELGGFASVLHRLHLRDVPVTVLATAFVAVNWLLCHAGMHYLGSPLARLFGPAVGWGVFAGAALASLPVVSGLVRPLAPLFRTHAAPAKGSLVGKVVEISTGRVDRGFGQARCATGGADLIVEVRADPGIDLRRGEKALVLSYEVKGDFYEVTREADVFSQQS
jgi:hypothetical protein